MVKDKDTIQIKSGNLKHECSRDHHIRHVNAKWIAKKYMDQFRSDPSWKINGIIQAVKTNQEVHISRLIAWRAKSIALKMLDGDEKTQITRLYDYRLELIMTHPRSTVMFKRNEGVFSGMYVCLAPLKACFLAGCRRIISVDGCFLKGLYGGQLLTAIGIDANDGIYPVAWAMVSKENHENWMWFLELLTGDLQITDSYKWAFMSDRQKERSCTCRRWQLTGLPCAHAISSIFYNKEKPEDYVDDCYKVTTFLQTYNHLLNPTQDSVCWPKSAENPMIPPELANKKRGRKPMLRKEAGDENVGFCNGRVSRKGAQKKCSICGVQGHNKRYHGLQGNNRRETTQEVEQIVGEANDDTNCPMEAIDPQVDLLNKKIGNEEPVAGSNVSESVPQMVNISVQAFLGLAPEIQTKILECEEEEGEEGFGFSGLGFSDLIDENEKEEEGEEVSGFSDLRDEKKKKKKKKKKGLTWWLMWC
ncbi:uncharacterized protein LOC120255910 [Dioscorea cayenensis subsp. rotundata]|uniref:Uncharacterized protein LOC120255910 n=1 Tax=Dioscorea cayennensis subsp. rotundata TaxID=55577 RepID=A0AB40AX96_DIOCR|nr:uncharacterized protein LOC120255910 [Dioscorea cayenensis subsp. rotundata]